MTSDPLTNLSAWSRQEPGRFGSPPCQLTSRSRSSPMAATSPRSDAAARVRRCGRPSRDRSHHPTTRARSPTAKEQRAWQAVECSCSSNSELRVAGPGAAPGGSRRKRGERPGCSARWDRVAAEGSGPAEAGETERASRSARRRPARRRTAQRRGSLHISLVEMRPCAVPRARRRERRLRRLRAGRAQATPPSGHTGREPAVPPSACTTPSRR